MPVTFLLSGQNFWGVKIFSRDSFLGPLPIGQVVQRGADLAVYQPVKIAAASMMSPRNKSQVELSGSLRRCSRNGLQACWDAAPLLDLSVLSTQGRRTPRGEKLGRF